MLFMSKSEFPKKDTEWLYKTYDKKAKCILCSVSKALNYMSHILTVYLSQRILRGGSLYILATKWCKLLIIQTLNIWFNIVHGLKIWNI